MARLRSSAFSMGLPARIAVETDAAGAPPSPVRLSLDAARRAVEVRFLQAGDVLTPAAEGVGRLIAALDQLALAVDPANVDATTAELNAAAANLLTLPGQHARRREIIRRLGGAGPGLTACIDDMRRHLAYLRVFAINIKITAGGIAAAGPEFGRFAQEISDRIARGRAQLEAFNRDLEVLCDGLGTALVQENNLADHSDRLLPAIPNGLTASAADMAAYHQQLKQVAAEATAFARDVQTKVGSALAALQIGDITRQRIEHAQQALDHLVAADDLAPEPQARLEGLVHGLLAAQLEATAADFHRGVARISQNMSGLAVDAAEILRLRDLAFGRQSGGGFLKRVDDHVAQALDLVDRMETAGLSAVEVGRSAASGAEHLSDQIAGLQSIKTDVQQMALNTTLKCTRIGETGKPLAVIAVELRLHAGALDTSARDALAALTGLSDEAAQLADGPGEGGGGGRALSDAAARLHSAGQAVDADLGGLAREGDAVVEALRHAAGRLDFQREIGVILDEAAAALAAQAGNAGALRTDDLAAPLATLLARIAKDYTMASEREVHQAYVERLDTALF
jgi:hypothetical protein